MRAVVVREAGGPEVLRLEEVPDPKPGPGEVLVRVEAVGINHADLTRRAGGAGDQYLLEHDDLAGMPISIPEATGTGRAIFGEILEGS